ncbi:hypothetical protein NQT69_19050 [Pseudoalteromonas shioyasakiensis]|uniref:hypothetical protein n=1 Tax=Pseudoalteromonas shioyasakiensis TaxID=1190813 RepID=UPI002117302D|nr:hypothetical protein [Pseudoalteromonas shioyasakiensis]MCQ8880101.1 hypothetical protein [Pseudoalteromonas shioyasakiensis]
MRFSLCAVLLPLFIAGCSDAATPEAEQLKPAPTVLSKNNQAVAIDSQSETISKDSIQAAHAQLKSLTADLSCDTSAQCQVLPVGSRACGGPSSYLVFSTKNSDSEKVEQIAKRITSLESQLNAQTGMMSICQHLTAPAAQCSSNKCVKVAGNSASVY